MRPVRNTLLAALLLCILLPSAPAAAAPQGSLTWAVHISAPSEDLRLAKK
jgi:hypothetical protein